MTVQEKIARVCREFGIKQYRREKSCSDECGFRCDTEEQARKVADRANELKLPTVLRQGWGRETAQIVRVDDFWAVICWEYPTGD